MGCVGKLGGLCKEKFGNDFKMRMKGMEGGWKRFEVVSMRGKGVWRG